MKNIDGLAVFVICLGLFTAYLLSPLVIAAWRHHRCVTVAVWDGALLWKASKACVGREE